MHSSYSLLQALASCQGAQALDQPVLDALGPAAIETAFADGVQRERVYHARPLFLTFFNQMLHHCSCRDAISHGTLRQWLPPTASPHNAAYCNARQRLAEPALQRLVSDLGQRVAAARPRPAGTRPIRVVDGSNVTLADTPANQAAYPQSAQQRPHCGFPLMFFVALMDLDSGALLDWTSGPASENERTRFRRLWDRLQPGDILLGDRGFDSYPDTALLQHRGIDTIFRLHATRKIDLSQASRLGRGDWILSLPAPVRPPEWADGQPLPPTLPVRLIEFSAPRHCRNRGRIRLITTLLDPQRYPKAWIMAIYKRRWDMELNLRHIKITLGLDTLAGRSPAMCRKELLMGLLVYNLVRWLMLRAGRTAEVALARISFKGTWQRCKLWLAAPPSRQSVLLDLLCCQAARDRVPDRPHRREPRSLKRRPKPYPFLCSSRRATIAGERRRQTR